LTEPVPGESQRDAYEREYAAEKVEGKPFWAALYKDAIVALIVVIAVVAVALVMGAPLEEPANPNSTNYAPRPEWYFLDLFQMLWYFGGSLEPLIIFGLFSLGALVFIAVPFVDRGRARHPFQRPAAMGLAALVVIAILTLTVIGLTSAPAGLAVVAARNGMTTTQLSGLEVYNRQGCAACHTIDGVGGTGGPGLSRAGTRYEASDMRGQITNPDDPAKMPAYPRLSEQDLDDLVEFLASLR
jgi:quinol-cytochrome oxidoreductase complex cytochrome b subunit